MAHGPIGLEGIDHLLVEYTRRKGSTPKALRYCPWAGDGCWRSSAPDPGGSGGAGGVWMHSLSRDPTRRRCVYSPTRAGKTSLGSAGIGLGVISHVPGEPLKWEGWEDAAVTPEKLGELFARPERADGPATAIAAPLRALRARLRPHAHQFRSCNRWQASAAIASLWKRPRTWWSATAARSRASTATGRRGRSSAPHVWPGTDAGVPGVQGALGSGVEDESGEIGGTLQTG